MSPKPALSELDELWALFDETQVPMAADASRDVVGRGADWLGKFDHRFPAETADAAAAACSMNECMNVWIHYN
jgi:hypothetical protein